MHWYYWVYFFSKSVQFNNYFIFIVLSLHTCTCITDTYMNTKLNYFHCQTSLIFPYFKNKISQLNCRGNYYHDIKNVSIWNVVSLSLKPKKKRFVQYGDACCTHPSEECSAEQVLVSLCQNLYCNLREFWWALANTCSAEHSSVVIWWDACCRKSSHASVLHFWQLEIMTTWEQGTLISKTMNIFLVVL